MKGIVFRMLLVAFILLAVSAPVLMAQGTQTAPAGGFSPKDWKGPLAGFAMAIASGLCGLGQGRAVASAAEGMARNPGAVAAIRGALILGLVLIESLALYTLVIIFVVS